MNLSTPFARFSQPLARLDSTPAAKVIDSAALARILRAQRYGPVPAKLPNCDKCIENEATVQAGALNYCEPCWDALGMRFCLACQQHVPIEDAAHAALCIEHP